MTRPIAIALVNDHGDPELNVPDSPQRMVVRLTNTSPERMLTRSERAVVALRFRRGTLLRLDRIRLAPQSHDWTLEFGQEGRHGDVLVLISDRVRLDAGEMAEIHLDHIVADPRGGTRATRVEAGWSGLETAARSDISESSRTTLLPMAVLRSRIGAHALNRLERSGSAARSGPFQAGEIADGGVLADGTPQTLRLAVVNTSGRPLRVSGDDDAASRLEVVFPRADDVVPWGLVKDQGDSTIVEIASDSDLDGESWDVHHHALRALTDGHWGDRERLVIDLTLTSNVEVSGTVPVTIRYVDFPDVDDGELTILVEVRTSARG